MTSFLLGILVAIFAISFAQGRVEQRSVSGLAGERVHLPCDIDEAKCGRVHNIQWYRGDGDTRVYIFSELAGVETDENMLMGRGYFHYTKDSATTSLEINPLMADDESLYKCELTYLEVHESCSVIQFVNLTTMAKPDDISIVMEDGSQVQSGSTIGPFMENTDLMLRCESAGGKPAADVTWWKNTVNIGGEQSAVLQADRTSLGTNMVHMVMTRDDLGAKLECQAVNSAMEFPLRATVLIDLYVRPSSVRLTGVTEPVLEGSDLTLTCRIVGARPAANATWLIGGEPITDQPDSRNMPQEDGTTATVSVYRLEADRELGGQEVVCIASNQVTDSNNEPPMASELVLQVLYAPSVNVAPDNITVNESMDVLLFCSFNANPANLSIVQWYKNGELLDLSNPEKYEGASTEQPSLFIKNTSRSDSGVYRCEVGNEIGISISESFAAVHVIHAPEVSLELHPGTVQESNLENITIRCLLKNDLEESVEAGRITEGSSAGSSNFGIEQLQRVRWYIGDNIIKETAVCNSHDSGDGGGSDDVACSSDPSELVFISVDRSFHANYSCSALNAAGWGVRSHPRQLTVFYPPRNATVTYAPAAVRKGESLVLRCSVEDSGSPPVHKFTWMRGNHVVTDITESTWNVDAVTLEYNANFSCVARNNAGSSNEAQAAINVLAKPQFIERLPPYMGALMNSSEISFTCRVECSPLCEIQWLRNGQLIAGDSRFYRVKSSHLAADPHTNDFQSVVSTLSWNMEAWPQGALDREQDSANYTCTSTSNPAGPGVTSHGRFSVEYPPENVVVSPLIVDVVEGDAQLDLSCTSRAHPDASYIWKHGGQVIRTGATLELRPHGGIQRHQAGEYFCHAQNKHGETVNAAVLNVMYTPSCTLTELTNGGERRLVCGADSVPDNVTFTWTLDNETLTASDSPGQHRRRSELVLPSVDGPVGTVYCHVTNPVGVGQPCAIDVSGVQGWMTVLGGANTVAIVVVVLLVLLLLAIVCVVVFFCCRRNGNKEKYIDPEPRKERDNTEGISAADDVISSHLDLTAGHQHHTPLSATSSTHKWPNRPGVHVHVASVTALSQSYRADGAEDALSRSCHADGALRCADGADSASDVLSSGDGVSSHLAETNANIGHESTILTPAVETPNVEDRETLKPSANGRHQDKAIYENLPFHGLQPPPAKQHPEEEVAAGRAADESQGSRPPSELSLNGSSGYGSTFSQQYDSGRFHRSHHRAGSTRSDAERRPLGTIPQSPDPPTVQPENTGSDLDSNAPPTPPRRGATVKPPYHNLSLPYRGSRAVRRPPADVSKSGHGGGTKSQSLRGKVEKENSTPKTGTPQEMIPLVDETPSHSGSEYGDIDAASMPRHLLADRGFYSCQLPAGLPRADSLDHRLRDCLRPRGPEPGRRRPATSRANGQSRAASSAGSVSGDQSRPVLPDVSAARPPITFARDRDCASGFRSQSRVQKQYVPTRYTVMHLSGISQEIDV